MRRPVVQGLVFAAVIVEVEVPFQATIQIGSGLVVLEVDVFVFHAPPLSFDRHSRSMKTLSSARARERLKGNPQFIAMNFDQTKNRQRAELPLRTDLADDLRTWLATLRDDHQGPSDAEGERIALTFQRDAGNALPLDTPLFNVPKGLVRILDRDLIAAGIPKRDERGRTIDVHALRHSFATMLSTSGVAPRTAQAAIRQST